jgi:hypothetical protein
MLRIGLNLSGHLFVLSFTLLQIQAALSCDGFFQSGLNLNSRLLPDNWWSSHSLRENDLSQAEVEQLLQEIVELYQDYAKSEGKILRGEILFGNEDLNAYAEMSSERERVVSFTHGIIKYEFFGLDELALIACHEVGHHYGGAPLKSVKFLRKYDVSSEGQSDYFATQNCMKKYLNNKISLEEKRRRYHPLVLEKCSQVYLSQQALKSFHLNYEICLRTSLAAENVATMLNRGQKVDFAKPNSKIVTVTDTTHPQGQCRLDTFFAGMLCEKSFELGSRETMKSGCQRKNGAILGNRPRCWFSD